MKSKFKLETKHFVKTRTAIEITLLDRSPVVLTSLARARIRKIPKYRHMTLRRGVDFQWFHLHFQFRY